jgi:NAD(P)-dependent dehydrogenase (short-subunit alcohol dehydrogenase family)
MHGRIDLIVNNAGCAAFGPVMEMDLEVFKDVFDVNLFGVVAVSKVCRMLLHD